MNITVNGKVEKIEEGQNVLDLLIAQGIKPEVVAVEVNGEVLEKDDYGKIKLKDGDQLEFVYFMGGGALNNQAQKSCQKIAADVTSLIGNTPLIRLGKIIPEGSAEILAKLESASPGGSVKDRIALSLINTAEKEGKLRPGGTIIEPTSGNTGIGLALIAAAKGYKCILTMPESMSLERIFILKSYGAEVVLTPAVKGMKGAIEKAEQLLKKSNGAFMPQQFKSLANPEIHRQTTAIEILEATVGRLDAFVAGVGTGGTLTGVGEVLKKQLKSVLIVAVEPASSAVLSGKSAGPHKIQGIGAGFIPEVLNQKIIDEIITIDDDEAFAGSKRLAKEEGLFVGISAGAALVASLKVAKKLGTGKRVVTIFPDTGERYFSMEQYFTG